MALKEYNPLFIGYANRLVEMIEQYNMNYSDEGEYLGLFWQPGSYPNAVTNQLFLVLNLRLYSATKQTRYL